MGKGIEEKYGKLNENYLVVLKHKPNSNKVELNRVPVKCTLEYSDKSGKSFYSSSNSILDIGKTLNDLKNLDILDYEYKYCDSEKLDSYTEKYVVDLDETIEKFEKKSKFVNKENELPTQEEIKSLRMKTCAKINNWFKVHSLEETYKHLDLDSSIIMYSHRMRGWNSFKNKIDDDFSIEVNTNFGFGRASYFYTKLIYKGLNVVKYTDWIYYNYSNLAEMINYSSTHELRDESWHDAINYVSRAYNTYVTSEKIFVRVYIINELDKFINGLKKLLQADKEFLRGYKFLDEEKKHSDFNEDGHNINEFKGRKMSGALDFIPIIKKFNTYTEANKFINEIENLCRDYLPILPEEVAHINCSTDELNVKIKNLKSEIKLNTESCKLTELENKYKHKKEDSEYNYSSMESYNIYKLDLETKLIFNSRLKASILKYIDKIERKIGVKKESFIASPVEPIVDDSEDYPSFLDDIPLPDISDYPEFANDYSRSNNNRHNEAPIDYSHNEASSEVDDLPF